MVREESKVRKVYLIKRLTAFNNNKDGLQYKADKKQTTCYCTSAAMNMLSFPLLYYNLDYKFACL